MTRASRTCVSGLELCTPSQQLRTSLPCLTRPAAARPPRPSASVFKGPPEVTVLGLGAAGANKTLSCPKDAGESRRAHKHVAVPGGT